MSEPIKMQKQTYNISEKLLEISSRLLAIKCEDEIDFQKLTDELVELSGAKFGVFNLYTDDGRKFTNKAISGASEKIEKAYKLLGFGLKNKLWDVSPKRLEEIKGGVPVRFDNLAALARDVLPETLCNIIAKTFNTGSFFVIEIAPYDKIIGDFILIFEKDSELLHSSAVSTFSNIMGLAINRYNTEKANREKEKALLESEANLTSVLESTNESIWSVNRDYFILTINNKFKSEFLKYYGIELKKGMKITDFVPPNEKELWINRYRKVFRGEKIKEVDEYGFSDNKLYIELRVHPIIENNTITGASVITNNITGRVQSEKLIQQSEEKFRKAFQTNPDSININLLNDGRYVSINNGFTQITGYTADEVIGKTSIELQIWENPNDRVKLRQGLSTNGVVENMETAFRAKNGDIIIGLMSASLIDLDGIPHIFSITRDITQRKRSEQIQKVLYDISKISTKNQDLKSFLFKLHEQVNTILNARNFYVSLYDSKSDTYTFPYYEDEAEEYENLSPVKMKGSLTDFVRREGKGKLLSSKVKDEVIKDKDIVTYGNPAKVWMGAPMYSGSSKEVIGVIALQDYKNKGAYSENDLKILEIIAFNIGVFVERIQHLEALKEAKDHAEESDRLKSAFLANMSHEIRTPMNGILGFADLLKEPELSGEEQKKYVRIIEKSGLRMLNIINDLIDISKIEAGQMDVKLSQTNINAQAEYLCTFFKPEMQKKAIKLITKFPPANTPLIFITDREKLYAIITNLLKNAIKYTNEGTIEFGFEVVQAETHSNAPRFAHFYIKDTGIGIPEDRLEAVFERFIQADIEDKKALEGAGLGLAITKAYVEMLGGKIRVESVEGRGSTFYFSIPDKAIAEKSPNPEIMKSERKEKTQNRQLKILVAEDDETSRMHLSIVLAPLATEIIFATTGTEAVNLCRQNPDTDLVLMDIKMPVMNGYEATRLIRKFNKKVVIISQTAYALSGDREKSMKAGCDDYISKPLKVDILQGLISKHIKKLRP